MQFNRDHDAIVLGMDETGLGVIRALGRHGIRVYGFDSKHNMAFKSKFVKGLICPDPAGEREEFLKFIEDFAKRLPNKPVVYVTSDNFVEALGSQAERMHGLLLLNLPSTGLIRTIVRKDAQMQLAQEAGIQIPVTYPVHSPEDIEKLPDDLPFPLFMKGLYSHTWRQAFGSTIKGFVIETRKDLEIRAFGAFNRGAEVLVQEIIPGPDTNHYKVCVYISPNGKVYLGFTLRKLRQYPPRFGIGCLVESVRHKDLMHIGLKLFKRIGYTGVGSAEFKWDARTGEFKLIEINPRYWQQNALATACGMNFPLIQYLDMTGQKVKPSIRFRPGIRWLNQYMDFQSFLSYRREGTLSLPAWLRSLSGHTILADFTIYDPGPFFHEIRYGLKLVGLFKRLLRRDNE